MKADLKLTDRLRAFANCEIGTKHKFSDLDEAADRIDELEARLEAANVLSKRPSRYGNLRLCVGHQQEHNHSHFAGENCDYCRLLSALQEK